MSDDNNRLYIHSPIYTLIVQDVDHKVTRVLPQLPAITFVQQVCFYLWEYALVMYYLCK